MPEKMTMILYRCTKCGWVGKEPIELAGYLWDYEMHDACPICWENDADDNPVDIFNIIFESEEK